MSFQVVNTGTGEIAVMFPENPEYEKIAIEACQKCAEATPGNWVVLHILEVYRRDTRPEDQKDDRT